jgi:restriction system protein
VLRTQISNRFLNDKKVITAKTQHELDFKVEKQKNQWKKQEERKREQQYIVRMKGKAQSDTNQALAEIEQCRSILVSGLDKVQQFKWDKLYDTSEFTEDEPNLDTYIQQVGVPQEDKFLEFLLSPLKNKRLEKQREAGRLFNQAYTKYQYDKNTFLNKQKETNKVIDDSKKAFKNGEPIGVENYFKMILNNSKYPNAIKKSFDLQFIRESKTLVIDFAFPRTDDIPCVIEYKFIQTRKETYIKKMKKKDFDKFYEDVLYQVTLRTVYECFQADEANILEAVSFNGWLNGMDTATGQDFQSCVVSLHVNKEKFMSLNLRNVVPKDCFRNLKGLAAGPLHQMAPVRPILELNKQDSRFIESKEVLANINSIPNLAEMPWDDFEHLVRELFELYFSKIGGEVKVTRASREGGVDAVAFDPDPIRGGKFIIQAKRYNDIITPGFVRELYGTMTAEGAVKGILVTTSYYGQDSRDFAKDKPITLLDGSNLIHMFNEYGYNVRIDLKSK